MQPRREGRVGNRAPLGSLRGQTRGLTGIALPVARQHLPNRRRLGRLQVIPDPALPPPFAGSLWRPRVRWWGGQRAQLGLLQFEPLMWRGGGETVRPPA